MSNPAKASPCSGRRVRPVRLVVVWIDWYAYHVARFRGLLEALPDQVIGIELVGGVGVHRGLKFREPLPPELPIRTLMPDASWREVHQADVARRLWLELDRLDPEAVLVPGYYTLPGLAAALWARAHGRRSILMTESTAADHTRQAWKEHLKGLLLRTLFDQAVAGGRAHVRYLEQLGFPSARIGHRYDVVDVAGIAQAVTELRTDGSPGQHALPVNPYFLYVGRLAEEKNVEALIRAWADYRAAGGTWELVLVGDGPAAAGLHALAGTLPPAHQPHFTGHRDSKGILPAYAFAGCFVLPSSREPWGLVVNEAMAAGLPVLVSTACGSAEDLVHEGENGFTFSPADVSQLSALLKQIAISSSSRQREMRQRSIAIVDTYTPRAFGQEIAGLLST